MISKTWTPLRATEWPSSRRRRWSSALVMGRWIAVHPLKLSGVAVYTAPSGRPISRGHSVSVRVKPELFIGVRAVTSQFLTKSICKIGAVLRPPKC